MFSLQETDALVVSDILQRSSIRIIADSKLVRNITFYAVGGNFESSADADILYVLYVFTARDGRARDAHKSTESFADEQFCPCLIRTYRNRRTQL